MTNKGFEKFGGDVGVEKHSEITQEQIDADYLENVLSGGIDGINDAVKLLEIKIEDLSKENPDKANQLRESLRKAWQKFLVGFEVAGVIFLAGTANYARTRYAVKEEIAQDKTIHYDHEDKETTDIIEYLSGRKELDRETRFALIRTTFMSGMNRNHLTYPEELSSAPEKEFIEIIYKMADSLGSDKDNYSTYFVATLARIFREEKDWLSIFIPEKLGETSDIYEALWKVENLSGNPKIRWIDSESGLYGPLVINFARKSTYYSPLSNTIYISSPSRGLSFLGDNIYHWIQSPKSIGSFISEASHAKQFNEHPIDNSAVFIRDMANSLTDAIRTRNLRDSYEKSYSKPGALEHDAHSVIEPELKKKFYQEIKPKLKKDHE